MSDEDNTLLYVGGGLAVAAAALVAYSRVFKRSFPPTPGDYSFPFKDDSWLLPGQTFGGLAHVGTDVESPAPLFVWLHGNNDSTLHRGMGVSPGNDLRSLVPSTYIVAAPSQTANAKGYSLWKGFSLDDFVQAVEKATGCEVDRSRVILAGHSGAGCSPPNGLLSSYGSVRPSMLISIDTCLGSTYGPLYRTIADGGTDVRVYYQPFTWKRDFQGFANTFGGKGTFEQVAIPSGGSGNPHEDIVPAALRKVFT